MTHFFLQIVRYSSLLISVALLCCSCIGTSAVIHEYTLSPLQGEPGKRLTESAESILLMPVQLPLPGKNTGIVTRLDKTTITTSSTHLWAGSLQEQVTATLAENIRVHSSGNAVMIYPGSRFGDPALLIEIHLLRFDGSLSRDFTCTAIWTISDNKKGEVLEQKDFSITVPVDSNDYSGYVQAASRTLERLSDEISLSLQKLRRRP